jgi:hypothetical protein
MSKTSSRSPIYPYHTIYTIEEDGEISYAGFKRPSVIAVAVQVNAIEA